MFADEKILHMENPKNTTKQLLELINEFNKVARYKINIQKFVSFLYINRELLEREVKKTIPIIITLKRIKYLGLNLPKETKELYSENYEMLTRETENDTEKYTMLLDWKNQYCQNDYATQGNQQILCNPNQITNGIFHRPGTKFFFNLYGNTKDPK